MKNTILPIFLLVSFTTSFAQQIQIKYDDGLAVIVDECGGNSIGGTGSLSVESGLTKLKKISVTNVNAGGGMATALTFQFSLNTTGGGTPAYWSVIDAATNSVQPFSTNVTLNAAATLEYFIRFNPPSGTTAGGTNIVLDITNTSGGATDCAPSGAGSEDGKISITLNGIVVAPIPLTYVLALDRSGSMNEPAGGVRKIDKLISSANLFVDLLRAPSGAFTGDVLGLVKYDFNAVSYFDNAPVSSTIKAWDVDPDDPANKRLHPAAANDPSRLQPGTSTAIGKAVNLAIEKLLGTAGNACSPSGSTVNMPNKVLVLFSDGLENVPPYVDCSAHPANCLSDACLRQVKIYSIGLGDDYNLQALQSLPARSAVLSSAGYKHVDDITSDAGKFDLEAAFYKVFIGANNLSTIVDPTNIVGIADGTVKIVHSAQVTTSDLSAIFVIFENPQVRNLYSLKLLSPGGLEIIPGSMPGGLNAEVIKGTTYTIYKIDFAAATPGAFSGTWNVKIFPDSSTHEKVSQVPIGFMAAALSNVNLTMQTSAGDFEPGSEITAAVDIIESGINVSKVKEILMTVVDPAGKSFDLRPQLDAYGKWVGRFPHTQARGVYRVKTKATLYNMKGELATREDVRFVAIGNKSTPIPENEPCYLCQCLIISAILIFILVVVIIAIWRKRK